MRSASLVLVLALFAAAVVCWRDEHEAIPKVMGSMPLPFTRELKYESPELNGDDVYVLQSLIVRSPFVSGLKATYNYDRETEEAVKKFQSGNKLAASGIFDEVTAHVLLAKHEADGYKDNGRFIPGYKYKVYIPVYRNRSIETTGILYNEHLQVVLKFRARTHGQNLPNGDAMNQFAPSGSTPTGLVTFDLNSKEPDPVSYGPYPINRAVTGLIGNAAIILKNDVSTLRSGILLHTGEWSGWTTSQPMPNSHGCVHTWPQYCNDIWQALVKLGVEIRQNTDGQLPYPYKQQGLLSIEQID